MDAYPSDRLRERKRCLVSVGTTEFDALIQALDNHADEVVGLLKQNAFSCLTLQIGRGQFVPERLLALSSSNLRIEMMRFIMGLPTLIEHTSLVISHAGAGSILETLRAKRQLFVVVNETLMDNHQVELAEELSRQEYLSWAYPRNVLPKLREALSASHVSKDYPAADTRAFQRLLDSEFGNS